MGEAPVPVDATCVEFDMGYGTEESEPLGRGPEEAEGRGVGVTEPVPYGEELLGAPVPVGPTLGTTEEAVEFDSGYGAEEPELGIGDPEVGRTVPVTEGEVYENGSGEPVPLG